MFQIFESCSDKILVTFYFEYINMNPLLKKSDCKTFIKELYRNKTNT